MCGQESRTGRYRPPQVGIGGVFPDPFKRSVSWAQRPRCLAPIPILLSLFLYGQPRWLGSTASSLSFDTKPRYAAGTAVTVALHSVCGHGSWSFSSPKLCSIFGGRQASSHLAACGEA